MRQQWLFEPLLNWDNSAFQGLNSEVDGTRLLESPDRMASHRKNKSKVRWDKHTKKRPGAPEKGDARRTHGKSQPSPAEQHARTKVEQAQQTLTSLYLRREQAFRTGQSFNATQIEKAIEKTKKILNYWKQQVANQEF